MTDKKLTDAGISAMTTPTDDDLMYVVDAPGGTPASKKITWANIKATLKTYFDTLYATVSPPFTDTNTLIKGSSDATKLLRFEVDGFTSGQTRVMTPPNYDGTLATLAGTETFTNKRITRRVVSTTQSATPTINTDNGDIFEMTGLAQAITSLTTNLSGTPVKGDMMQMWITDNGTARAITPGASFAGTAEYPLAGLTTTVNKRLILLWEYTTIWELVGKINQA